jgi:hypothetical protein
MIKNNKRIIGRYVRLARKKALKFGAYRFNIFINGRFKKFKTK